jgi:autotransporter-associated beta strand protein
MNQRIPLMAVWISLLLLAGTPLRSVSTEGNTVYTWTGKGADNNWFNDANWDVTPAPNNYTTANVVFGDSFKNYIRLYDNTHWSGVAVYGLNIAGNNRPYYFDANGDGYLTMSIGAGGINYSPAQQVRSVIAADFEFTDDQTWDIASGILVLKGEIYDGDGGYTFTKTGAGTLVFGDSDNEFDYADIHLNNGRLVLSSSTYNYYGPLGSASLTIGPATEGNNPILVASDSNYGGTVTLDNDLTLNGALTTENQTELLLAGPVTLNEDTVVQIKGRPLFIEGSITEATVSKKLTINSAGAVVLSGSNGYTGGTNVAKGVLVFVNAASVPGTGSLSAASLGYIGRMFDPSGATMPLATYLDKFDKPNTSGTVGFDTDPEPLLPANAFNNFSEAIILTGFASDARLGSATQAILTGTITPQGTDYRFGGGGGLLIVSSQLTGSRAVIADSPVEAPLTVGLGSLQWNSGTSAFDPVSHLGNNFTGGVVALYSAVIFGPGAMPATGDFTLQTGGYIGNGQTDLLNVVPSNRDILTGVSSFLTKFPTTTDRGMIGFDYFGDGTARVTSDIDLTRFTNGSVYLGTATEAILSGTITPQGSTYRFGAYKGGSLEVASTLSGARNVIIGDPTSPATFGDYSQQEYSKVALTGNNSTLTGPIMLYGGQLLVGQHATDGTVGTTPTTALGWNTTTGTGGTLVVAGMTLPAEWQGTEDEPPAPRLGATASGLIIPNNITLNTELNVGGDNSFAFTGIISGTGELYVGEDSVGGFTLGLNGNNTFSGGVYVAQGAIINAGSNTALGTGPVGFGYSGGRVNFLTAAPIIGSLMTKDDDDYADLYATQNNTVLTINQSIDGTFQGAFRSSATFPYDNLRVIKNGTGTLRLDNGSLAFENGTTEILLDGSKVALEVKQGTLIIGSDFSTDNTLPAIFWVNGGTLAVDGGNNINNPIVLGANARLAGTGSFTSDVSIGSGAVLSPGLAGQGEIGTLQFSHLELNGGGTLEWQVQNPAPDGQAGRDLVRIYSEESYTLVINATAESPFTVKIISLSLAGVAGELSGFDPSQPYTWTLFDYDYMSGGFDPAKFSIDASGFANSLAFDERGNGFFSLSLYSSSEYNNQVLLNFTPVPEPSTYTLLALGLGLIGWSVWRRRQQ